MGFRDYGRHRGLDVARSVQRSPPPSLPPLAAFPRWLRGNTWSLTASAVFTSRTYALAFPTGSLSLSLSRAVSSFLPKRSSNLRTHRRSIKVDGCAGTRCRDENGRGDGGTKRLQAIFTRVRRGFGACAEAKETSNRKLRKHEDAPRGISGVTSRYADNGRKMEKLGKNYGNARFTSGVKRETRPSPRTRLKLINILPTAEIVRFDVCVGANRRH